MKWDIPIPISQYNFAILIHYGGYVELQTHLEKEFLTWCQVKEMWLLEYVNYWRRKKDYFVRNLWGKELIFPADLSFPRTLI